MTTNPILSQIGVTGTANLFSAIANTVGTIQGELLYCTNGSWTVLTPGTNGQVLQSGGSSANVSWTNTVSSVVANSTLTGGTITTTGTLGLNLANVNGWSGQQYFAGQALTPGTAISWNLSTQQAATLTATSNFTLNNPTNMQNGATYSLVVTQDSTGSRVITWGSAYKFPGGAKFVLSTGTGAIDVITFLSDGTNMYSVGQPSFS